MGIHDMVIRYGESLWPGTSPRPGENRSGQLDQGWLTRWVGWRVANLFAVTASSGVIGWNTCHFHNPQRINYQCKWVYMVGVYTLRHTTPEVYICTVWPSVHTNPSEKRSFSKTPFKPEEFENGAFRRRWRHDHVISLTECFFQIPPARCGRKTFDAFSQEKSPFSNPPA